MVTFDALLASDPQRYLDLARLLGRFAEQLGQVEDALAAVRHGDQARWHGAAQLRAEERTAELAAAVRETAQRSQAAGQLLSRFGHELTDLRQRAQRLANQATVTTAMGTAGAAVPAVATTALVPEVENAHHRAELESEATELDRHAAARLVPATPTGRLRPGRGGQRPATAVAVGAGQGGGHGDHWHGGTPHDEPVRTGDGGEGEGGAPSPHLAMATAPRVGGAAAADPGDHGATAPVASALAAAGRRDPRRPGGGGSPRSRVPAAGGEAASHDPSGWAGSSGRSESSGRPEASAGMGDAGTGTTIGGAGATIGGTGAAAGVAALATPRGTAGAESMLAGGPRPPVAAAQATAAPAPATNPAATGLRGAGTQGGIGTPGGSTTTGGTATPGGSAATNGSGPGAGDARAEATRSAARPGGTGPATERPGAGRPTPTGNAAPSATSGAATSSAGGTTTGASPRESVTSGRAGTAPAHEAHQGTATAVPAPPVTEVAPEQSPTRAATPRRVEEGLRARYAHLIGAEAPPAGDAATQAAGWDDVDDYPGADRWLQVTLPAGTVVLATGRMYPEGRETHGGGAGYVVVSERPHEGAAAPASARASHEGRQVVPRRDADGRWAYPAVYSSYRLAEPVVAAVCLTEANPQWGPGGARQHFIPDFRGLVRTGVLQHLATRTTGDTAAAVDAAQVRRRLRAAATR